MQHGWSKAELARRARLDQSLMSKIELRRVNPYPVELARLASALDLPADILMTEEVP
jgi:transcriptional regulator with XRE-family HTH domain